MPKPFPSWRRSAFTLVELLAVVAIMVLLMAFVVPVVSGIKGGRDIVSNVYTAAGTLEQARTYAMANNTYTWVGFYEEDGSKVWSSAGGTTGSGRVIMASYASRDGLRDTSAATTLSADLMLLGKLQKLENTHLRSSDDASVPWPTGNVAQVSSYSSTAKKVTYPLNGTTYTFSKIIEFTPLGEAHFPGTTYLNAAEPWIGIGFQPTHGSALSTGPAPVAAILIDQLTGQIKVVKR